MEIGKEVKSKFSSAIQKAHINVMFSANWLKSKISDTIRPFNITAEQYNVLRILRGSHPQSICVKDITGRMIERSSNSTRIIDKLEAKDLARREPSLIDKRALNIHITPSGLELLSKIDELLILHEPDATLLSEDEALILSDLLDKMRESH